MLQDLDSGQLRDAVLLGQQAVSRWPRDAQLRHYLGVAYFKTGDTKQAQEQLRRARELNPKDSATHFDLALVLLSQQDYAAAAEELEAAVKLRPSNALAHMLLGRAYLNSTRSLQAIEEFKTTLKLDPAIGSDTTIWDLPTSASAATTKPSANIKRSCAGRGRVPQWCTSWDDRCWKVESMRRL